LGKDVAMLSRALGNFTELHARSREQRKRERRAGEHAEREKQGGTVIPKPRIGERGENRQGAPEEAKGATGSDDVAIRHFVKKGLERTEGNLPNAII